MKEFTQGINHSAALIVTSNAQDQVLFGAYYKTRPNCQPDGVSGQKLIRDPSKLATRWEISSKIN